MNDKMPLSATEIEEKLSEVRGWKYADNKISKEFKFPGFMPVVNFINQLAPFCEEHDHHPDIHIFYNKVRFDLQRFDIGGKVTARDFMVAKEIDRLFAGQ